VVTRQRIRKLRKLALLGLEQISGGLLLLLKRREFLQLDLVGRGPQFDGSVALFECSDSCRDFVLSTTLEFWSFPTLEK